MLLSAVTFSLAGILIKIIDWSPVTINGVRSIFAAAVMFAFMKATGHKIRVNKTVIFAALCNVVMNLTYVCATKNNLGRQRHRASVHHADFYNNFFGGLSQKETAKGRGRHLHNGFCRHNLLFLRRADGKGHGGKHTCHNFGERPMRSYLCKRPFPIPISKARPFSDSL